MEHVKLLELKELWEYQMLASLKDDKDKGKL